MFEIYYNKIIETCRSNIIVVSIKMRIYTLPHRCVIQCTKLCELISLHNPKEIYDYSKWYKT